jgi:TonB family protein
MLTAVIVLSSHLLLPVVSTSSQTPAKQQVCQMPANLTGLRPFAFVPRTIGKGFNNPIPVLSYSILEDGIVSNVKVIKSTGSAKFDDALVKSISSWKYRAQPGCAFDTKVTVNIDLKSGGISASETR